MRLAVFLPNLIGDAVMATPTLRALRRGFPDAELIGVMRSSIAAVLAGSGWLDRTILYRPRSVDHEERFWGVIRHLCCARPETAVLLPNSFRSALMARLGGCGRVVGYGRGGRGPLLTDRLVSEVDGRGAYTPTPVVHAYLAVARHLGCPPDSTRLELCTTVEEEVAADAAWERLGLGAAEPVVVLNTGGAFGPAKNWPVASFAHLARRLARETLARVLVICGPAERENARAIVRLAADERVVSLADEAVSIGLTKACLRRCQLVVTTDSGPRHIATAFDRAVVTLFGPTHIAWTRTYHPRAVHLQVPVPCGPCQRPSCAPGHHRCMRELSPDAVFEAATRLLGAGGVATSEGPYIEIRRSEKVGAP